MGIFDSEDWQWPWDIEGPVQETTFETVVQNQSFSDAQKLALILGNWPDRLIEWLSMEKYQTDDKGKVSYVGGGSDYFRSIPLDAATGYKTVGGRTFAADESGLIPISEVTNTSSSSDIQTNYKYTDPATGKVYIVYVDSKGNEVRRVETGETSGGSSTNLGTPYSPGYWTKDGKYYDKDGFEVTKAEADYALTQLNEANNPSMTAYQQAEISLAQQQLAYQQQQAALSQQNEERQYLAQLAAEPVSWLQYHLYEGTPPVVQPWMVPLSSGDYPQLQIGQQIPGWQGIPKASTQTAAYTPVVNNQATITSTTPSPVVTTPATSPPPSSVGTTSNGWQEAIIPDPYTPTTSSDYGMWTEANPTLMSNPVGSTWNTQGFIDGSYHYDARDAFLSANPDAKQIQNGVYLMPDQSQVSFDPYGNKTVIFVGGSGTFNGVPFKDYIEKDQLTREWMSSNPNAVNTYENAYSSLVQQMGTQGGQSAPVTTAPTTTAQPGTMGGAPVTVGNTSAYNQQMANWLSTNPTVKTTPASTATGVPDLLRPSVQYTARMGPTALQEYLGYEQYRTGARPEETQFRLWSSAPPSGKSPSLSFRR